MVQHRKAGGNPPQPPPSPPRTGEELSHVEFDLQVHRDETSARFSEINDLVESMRAQQTQILAELRQLRLTNTKATISQADSLQFGSLPASSGTIALPLLGMLHRHLLAQLRVIFEFHLVQTLICLMRMLFWA